MENLLKYGSFKEWAKENKEAYVAARKLGLLPKIFKEFGWELSKKNKNFWTLEKCKEDALKYSTRKKWRAAKKNGYSSAVKNKWLDECAKHMPSRNKNWKKGTTIWSLEQCLEDAIKYQKRKEWDVKSPNAYRAALRNGWYEECTKHMKKRGEK